MESSDAKRKELERRYDLMHQNGVYDFVCIIFLIVYKWILSYATLSMFCAKFDLIKGWVFEEVDNLNDEQRQEPRNNRQRYLKGNMFNNYLFSPINFILSFPSNYFNCYNLSILSTIICVLYCETLKCRYVFKIWIRGERCKSKTQ